MPFSASLYSYLFLKTSLSEGKAREKADRDENNAILNLVMHTPILSADTKSLKFPSEIQAKIGPNLSVNS